MASINRISLYGFFFLNVIIKKSSNESQSSTVIFNESFQIQVFRFKLWGEVMDKNLLENCMQKLQNGDLNALDSIYKLTSKKIYYVSYYILKNTEHAKDIVHDT